MNIKHILELFFASVKAEVPDLGMEFLPVPGTTVLFSKWETRVQDYQVFAGDTNRVWPKPYFEQEPTHPAVNVSWNDAHVFCKWLTKREQKAGRLSKGVIYRLPTDREWSRAVGLSDERGDTPHMRSFYGDMDEKNVFPWGTEWPPPREAGNYGEHLRPDGYENTSPVGSFKPNQFGLYDMGGNVDEFCEDSFINGADGEWVVQRGGSCTDSLKSSIRSCYRKNCPSSFGHDSMGFRVVMGLPPGLTRFCRK